MLPHGVTKAILMQGSVSCRVPLLPALGSACLVRVPAGMLGSSLWNGELPFSFQGVSGVPKVSARPDSLVWPSLRGEEVSRSSG